MNKDINNQIELKQEILEKRLIIGSIATFLEKDKQIDFTCDMAYDTDFLELANNLITEFNNSNEKYFTGFVRYRLKEMQKEINEKKKINEAIRKQVVGFMEHNEYLSKLRDEKWFGMEDSLVAFIESITHQKDTTYTQQEQIQLADGNYVTLVNGNYILEILDDFGQVMESFDINIKNQTKTEIVNQLQQLDKYEYMDRIFTSYDYEEDYQKLMETYFEDITLGNGADAVEQEIKDIKKDLETMSEKDFCEMYGIFKIGNMYFRS